MRRTLAILAALAVVSGAALAGETYQTIALLSDVTMTNASTHTATVDLNEYQPSVTGKIGLHAYTTTSGGHGSISNITMQVSMDGSTWGSNTRYTTNGTATNDLSTVLAPAIGGLTNVVTELDPVPARFVKVTFQSSTTATNTLTAKLTVH